MRDAALGMIKSLPFLKGLFAERDWLRSRVAHLEPYKTWMPPGHFYSPIPDRDEVLKRREAVFGGGVARGVETNLDEQLRLLREMLPHYAELPFSETSPRFDRFDVENSYFTYADAICLWLMLRHVKPKRVIEIGSGHSSALILDACDRFPEEAPTCVFVDPNPERLMSLLREEDHQRARIITECVQDVELSLFDTLAAGDFLFIDSSHVAKVGSDVNFLFFEVLARLSPGVFVHVHDVFGSFEYPEEWIAEGRAWNEAYLVRAFLMWNSAFEVTLMNGLAQSEAGGFLAEHMPLMLRSVGRSLWMRRVETA